MKKLQHSGWVYAVSLEGGQQLAFTFQTEQDALAYCKDRYPNSLFQILPLPVFEFKEAQGDPERDGGR